MPAAVLQRFLDELASGRTRVAIHGVFDMAHIAEAHRIMESNGAVGKMVVRVRHGQE